MPLIRHLILSVLLCLSLLGNSAAAVQPVTLQLKWYHQFQFAGYYAALEKGFYREAGLDVTILEGSPERDPIEAVLAGEADFGIGASELLLAYAEGQPVVALAAIFQHSPLILLAREGPELHTFHDLVGKSIEIVPHEYELFALLQAMGYGPADFILKPRKGALDDLIGGRVAAVSAYSTDEPYLLAKAQIPYIAISPRSAGVDFYGDTLFTRAGLLAESPQTVRAFREASLRGWAYAMAHPEEIAELILRRYKPEREREHLLYEARTMRHLILPELVELGYMHPGRWKHIADTYAQLALLPADVPLDDFLYQPQQQPDLTWFYWSGAGALLLVLLISGIAIYILNLNGRLREKEERYRALFETAPVAILVWDRQRRITQWNRQAEHTFGWSAGEAIGRDFLDFMVPTDEAAHVLSIADTMFGGATTTASFNWNLTKSGRRILCEWRNTVLHDSSGEVTGMVAEALDITEKHRIEEALRDSERRYRLLAENAVDVIWTMDLNGRFTYVSPSVERLRGYSVEEVLQQDLRSSLTPETAHEAEEGLAHLHATGEVLKHRWEVEQYCKDGSTVWTDVNVNVVRDAAGKPQEILGITRDATQRKRLEERLQQMAHFDMLTGLPNRALFFDRLESALHLARRNHSTVALLFLDLDGFKGANDTYGHDFGDAILREVAARLQQSVRESDTVARMGGDEFTLILHSIDSPQDAAHVAEKVTRAISAPFCEDDREWTLSTSIGISLYPRDGDTRESLLNMADKAMYEVKHSGKNSYRFYS